MDLPEETILINKNLELEKRIKLLETDVIKYKSKDDSSLV
jgi:ribosome-associated protein YbcJ (S4-like RNA binding protein)